MDGAWGFCVDMTREGDPRINFIMDYGCGARLPRETTRERESRDQIVETFLISGILWPECCKRVFEPETGQNSWSTVSWTYDIKGRLAGLANEPIEMS